MAKKPTTDTEEDPVSLAEPGSATKGAKRDDNPWLRGLWMVFFAILFQVAQWVLWVATVIQFLWILFARERNGHIADFGDSLSKWLARVARFQTAASEDKPFPFSPWGQ